MTGALGRGLAAVRAGTVTAFDEHRGLGELTDGEGTVLRFHCTAIADGTRTIEVGAAVLFRVRAGLLGPEASAITTEAMRPRL